MSPNAEKQNNFSIFGSNHATEQQSNKNDKNDQRIDGQESLLDLAKEKKDEIFGGLADKKDQAVDTIEQKKDEMVTAVQDKKEQVTNAMGQKKDQVVTAVEDKKEQAANAAESKKYEILRTINPPKGEEKEPIQQPGEKEQEGLLTRLSNMVQNTTGLGGSSKSMQDREKIKANNKDKVEGHEDKNILDKTKDTVGSVVDSTKDTVGSAVNGTKDAVGSALNGTKDAVGSAFNGTKDAVGSAINGTKDAVGSTYDSVSEKVQSVVTSEDKKKTNDAETHRQGDKELSEKTIQEGSVELGKMVQTTATGIVDDLKSKFEDRLNENSAGEKIDRSDKKN